MSRLEQPSGYLPTHLPYSAPILCTEHKEPRYVLFQLPFDSQYSPTLNPSTTNSVPYYSCLFPADSGDNTSRRISDTCKKGPKGANLFVYHLPTDVNSDDLITLFSFFGPLVSAKVGIPRIGKS